ncbi:hypothetical protein GCM10023213_14360 [Prosthecobacter algae]|uniref:Uncharacterized protein n=1 Tax=Prosthecobacter algae TaxID=1144682 RepID=A0ABP9P2E9_9BACT
MTGDLPLPDFRSLLQELDPAFTQGAEYTLTEPEVELVFLSLHRLAAIEELVAQKDWETLARYCPPAL